MSTQAVSFPHHTGTWGTTEGGSIMLVMGIDSIKDEYNFRACLKADCCGCSCIELYGTLTL